MRDYVLRLTQQIQHMDQLKDDVVDNAFAVIDSQFGFFSTDCCLLHDRKITVYELKGYSGRIGFSRT